MAVNNPTDVSPLVKAMNEFRDVVDSRAASIEARLGTDNRGAWSAVGAAVMTVAAGAAVTTWLAAAPARSGVSNWPAYVFAVVALAGAYLLVAPLTRCWPFTAPSSIPGLLDECIRAGRDARERITYEQLKPLEEAREVAQWTLRTANRLHAHYPAIADRFLLASGDESSFSGQALLIQTVNAKLSVLGEARTGISR
jgi:hypothetical protein